ncbi:MAG: SDR family NAD(P)-dependent oxidoreductase [Halanaerobiales bacterium]
MISIKGKWALVTGASRGVGRQIANGLAEKGCNLVLHSRNTEHTSDLKEELDQHGIEVLELAADLAFPEEAMKMAEKAEELTGGIDILYNNAAISVQWREDFSAPIEEYRKVFDVNVISPIKICDVILPRMRERGFGRIVNLSSGIQDQPELTPYAISKAAIDKYVKDMAVKLEGSDVLMNLLDPGWLRTDLGGPDAPDPVESVLPGALVPVLLEKQEGSGTFFRAQDYNK